VTPTIPEQLFAAAAWAVDHPGYDVTAPLLRLLARHVAAGALDLSRLAAPIEGEGAWSGLVRRLKCIGVDVWEMCPPAQEAA
jgi:hypothetical protein